MLGHKRFIAGKIDEWWIVPHSQQARPLGMLSRLEVMIIGSSRRCSPQQYAQTHSRNHSPPERPVIAWLGLNHTGVLVDSLTEALAQEQVAMFFVPLGRHHSWPGLAVQICIPPAVACHPSGAPVDVGRARHWILQPLRGRRLHPITRRDAAPGSAVSLHPWHRDRQDTVPFLV